MKSDITIDLQKTTKTAGRFVHRHHLPIFVLLVLGGLSAATFMLYTAATAPQEITQQSTNAGFDKKTIEKINQLRSPTDTSAPLVLPSGRTNPFEE